mgnify:CR=1 FL=1
MLALSAVQRCNKNVIKITKTSMDPLSKCRFRQHLPELNSFYPTNSVYRLKFA